MPRFGRLVSKAGWETGTSCRAREGTVSRVPWSCGLGPLGEDASQGPSDNFSCYHLAGEVHDSAKLLLRGSRGNWHTIWKGLILFVVAS